MSLKKPRIHITGISNIDYKSKIDIEKIFNNFNNYTIKPDKNNEPIDPTQVVVYKSPRPRKPNMYNVSLKEAMQQDGESLMYANTYRLRKELKLKRLEQNVNKNIGNNELPKINNKNQTLDVNRFKTEQNKQSDEQRLKTLRKDIHDKLYPHKNFQNIFVTWQKNYLKNNELSVFDLHRKINELGIPISYNEAIGLISMGNKRNTNTLNLDEFKNLFFIENEETNKNIKSITSLKIPENIDSKKIEDDYKIEEDNKYKKFINNKIFDNVHYNKLESMLHIKNSNFINSMNEINDKEKNKNGLCDFQTFKNVLDTLKIPEKYKNVQIAKSIFNEFKIENGDLMNYNNFIEKCKYIKNQNDFFQFQNNYINLFTNKLKDNEQKRNNCKDILLENDKKTKEYIKNLGASKACKSMDKILFNSNICNTEDNKQTIMNNQSTAKNKLKNNITIDYSNLNNNRYSTLNTEQNKINENNRYQKQLTKNENDNIIESYSHYQPSLNFINLLFKDTKKYEDKYNKGIQEFSPNNVMNLRKNKRPDGTSINSRYFNKKSNYPPIFMSYDNSAPGYIDEKERFEKNKMNSIDIRNSEMSEKIRRKKNELNERWNNMVKFQQKVYEVKESLGQIKRTHNLYEYENRNIIRQQIEE